MSLSTDILENTHVHPSPFVKENDFRLAGTKSYGHPFEADA